MRISSTADRPTAADEERHATHPGVAGEDALPQVQLQALRPDVGHVVGRPGRPDEAGVVHVLERRGAVVVQNVGRVVRRHGDAAAVGGRRRVGEGPRGGGAREAPGDGGGGGRLLPGGGGEGEEEEGSDGPPHGAGPVVVGRGRSGYHLCASSPGTRAGRAGGPRRGRGRTDRAPGNGGGRARERTAAAYKQSASVENILIPTGNTT